jgi:4'-phosphopantetheinyl transferase
MPIDANALGPLLSAAEQEAANRFRVAGRRRRYLLGRLLLRHVLAELLDAAPAEIGIEAGHNNRPELTGPWADQAERRLGLPLDFNLSSTPGRIACGVALGARVGVDVEWPRPLDDLHELARTVLAPEEITWMEAQDAPLHAFYRLWTLKEAAAKAHGEGLGLPFPALRLQPDEAGGLLADFDVLESHPTRWSVLGLEASGPAALALHWNDGTPGKIELSPSWPQHTGLEPIPVEATARL